MVQSGVLNRRARCGVDSLSPRLPGIVIVVEPRGHRRSWVCIVCSAAFRRGRPTVRTVWRAPAQLVDAAGEITRTWGTHMTRASVVGNRARSGAAGTPPWDDPILPRVHTPDRVPSVAAEEAYRLDLARLPSPRADERRDRLWLLPARLYELLAGQDDPAHPVLAGELGVVLLRLARESARGDTDDGAVRWARAVCDVLRLTNGRVPAVGLLDLAMRLAAVMDAAGFPTLAFNLLDTAGATFAPIGDDRDVRLPLELGRIAEHFGALPHAAMLYAEAIESARARGARRLGARAARALQRLRQAWDAASELFAGGAWDRTGERAAGDPMKGRIGGHRSAIPRPFLGVCGPITAGGRAGRDRPRERSRRAPGRDPAGSGDRDDLLAYAAGGIARPSRIVAALVRSDRTVGELQAAVADLATLCVFRRPDDLLHFIAPGGVAALITELTDAEGASTAPTVASVLRRLPALPVFVYHSPCSQGGCRAVDWPHRGVCTPVLCGVDEAHTVLARSLPLAVDQTPVVYTIRALPARLDPRQRLVLLAAAYRADRPVTVAQLARELALAPQQVGAYLRGASPLSARAILGWLRLLHAAWWLDLPGHSTASVARRLGYPAPGALRRALRHRAGVSVAGLRERGGFRYLLGLFTAAFAAPVRRQTRSSPGRAL
jgi:AraC-like DNA-binding protein